MLQFFVTKYNLPYIIIGRKGMSLLYAGWRRSLLNTSSDTERNNNNNSEILILDIISKQVQSNEILNKLFDELNELKDEICNIYKFRETTVVPVQKLRDISSTLIEPINSESLSEHNFIDDSKHRIKVRFTKMRIQWKSLDLL